MPQSNSAWGWSWRLRQWIFRMSAHHDPTTLELILQRLDKLSNRLDQTFERLDLEIREIKDSRYRPFFTASGAFLAVVVGVMSYIYSLEVRLRQEFYNLSDLVHDVQQLSEVNKERLDVTNERLDSRSNVQAQTWETHTTRHDGIDRGIRILVEKMIDRETRMEEAMKREAK